MKFALLKIDLVRHTSECLFGHHIIYVPKFSAHLVQELSMQAFLDCFYLSEERSRCKM